MKRPLAGVMTGYAVGILLGHFCQPAPVLLWSFVLVTGVLAWGSGRIQTACLWVLVVLAGWANLVSHTLPLDPQDLRHLLADQPVRVVVRGRVAEPPQVKIVERQGTEAERSQTILTVTALRRAEHWEPATGRVMATTPMGLDGRFFAGQRVEVTGVIAPSPPPVAPGLLDYRAWLATRGIYFQLNVRGTNDWQIPADGLTAPPPTQRFMDWSRRTLALGLPVQDEPLRLLWAMTLGWHTAFKGDLGDPFLQAGTMHLFAIDGLRIALVSGMLLTLLRVLRLPRAVCGLVSLPLIWFYTAATGWEPSAIRATVMMSIVILGWALHRPGDLLNSLAAAALLILFWDPTELFAAGFQLSFLVVLIIALMLPPMNAWGDARLKFDPLVPPELIPRWQRWGLAVLRHAWQLLALSIAAWVGSIPLSAKYFNLFSPVSPLANLVAVPLGIGALTSNLGSLVCGAWCPALSGLFNHGAWLFMLLLTRVSEITAHWPGAYLYVPAPPWPAIGLYYLGLVALLTGWLRWPKSLFSQGLALASLLVVAALGWRAWSTAQTTLTLTVLPLNGSQVVYVTGGGNTNQCLVNCGTTVSVDGTLKPFLRAQGVNRLSRLILTTGGADSCGGAERLNELFPVDALFTSDIHFRSPVYRDYVAQFDQRHQAHERVRLKDQIAGWTVLHPGPTNAFSLADDHALVLRRQFYGTTILLLSDLGREGQSDLLNRAPDLRADVVVASVPGRGEPLCAALIQAIHPRLMVINDAEFPPLRRATTALKQRLAATGIPVIYTRTDGAVTLTASPGHWVAASLSGPGFWFDTQ